MNKKIIISFLTSCVVVTAFSLPVLAKIKVVDSIQKAKIQLHVECTETTSTHRITAPMNQVMYPVGTGKLVFLSNKREDSKEAKGVSYRSYWEAHCSLEEGKAIYAETNGYGDTKRATPTK